MADKNTDILEEELKKKQELREQELAEKEAGDGSSKHRRRHHHHHHHSSSGKRKRRRRHRHRGKKRSVKRIIISAAILLVIALVLAAGIVYAMLKNGKNEMVSNDYAITAPEGVRVTEKGDYVTYNGSRYKYNKDVINILFLGVDKAHSDKDSKMIGDNYSSDVISLCTINSKTQKIHVINIPRDIYTEVSVYSPSGGYVGREKMAIANAYAYGDGKDKSCINSKEAVSRLFYNLPINTYFSLNLDGVAGLNDSIGGVDVKSPETIEEFEKGETYHLEGDEALRFVQLRSHDRADANLLRNERQKVYLNAFLKKFTQQAKKNPSIAVDLFNASKPYSCTNLNADKITYLVSEFIVNRNMQFDFKSIPVDVKQVEDHAENYVKETEFYEMFLNIFYIKVK